jgi:hypothetical protein
LDGKEVKAGFNPLEFTIDIMAAIVKRDDLFKAVLKRGSLQ